MITFASAPPSRARTVAATLVALAVIALALRAAALGSQPLIGDDVSVAQSARNFVELGWRGPTMWNHPRLRDLLVYLSLDLFGNGPWGIKAWSVLLGTLAAPLAALLALRLTASLPAAAVAGLIVAVDPLHLDFSRQGINDVYLSAFPVAAILSLLRYRAARHPSWLVLAGVLTGLGLASKWGGAFPVAATAAAVLWTRLRDAPSRRDVAQEVILFTSALVLLPLAIYVATFWPWFGRGHDLGEFLRLHAEMAFETSTHTGYPGTKLPGFPGEVVGAWRWFIQPIWYIDYLPPMPGRETMDAGFFLPGVANPLVWLCVLPSVALAGWTWLRRREPAAGWSLGLFLAAYLPFALVGRPIWTNTAVGVLPFAAVLVAWAVATLHARRPALVRAWAAAALVLAALLCPPAMGIATRASDATVRALVSHAALDPASR